MSLEKIASSGRKFLKVSLLTGLLALNLSLTSCDGDKSKREPQAQGISEDLQEKWPIWQANDLEYNKHGGPSLSYSRTIYFKPKFYNGSMPLKHTGTKTMGFGSMGMTSKVLSHSFDNFSNYFVYQNFNLVGAVAVDNNKMLLAEAIVRPYDGKTNSREINVEEFHYGGGLLVFHCKSKLGKTLGMKEKETERSGRKRKDYFFILPTGIAE